MRDFEGAQADPSSPTSITLEQVDCMMEEVRNPIKSAGWKPHSTFAADMGLNKSGEPPLETHVKVQPRDNAHVGAGTHAPHGDQVALAVNPAAASHF
jgi:hypothetical protein